MKVGSLDAVTNRETFQTERQVVDTETGEAIDLTGATIVFVIRRPGSTSDLLSATNGDGIGFADAYTYQITFSADRMRQLCTGTYEIGLTMERDGVTRQVIVGTLPVFDGVVP